MTSDVANEPPLLRVRGLQVSVAGQPIIRKLDLDVYRGEVVAILGPSGAGKTTLFRALAGETFPDSGSVVVRATDVTRMPLWERARGLVGYVPQSASILWDLTVRENLAVFERVASRYKTKRETVRTAEAAADEVNLGDKLDVRAGALSAGERRRLELARAMTRTPALLICDEPFAGVDPSGAALLGERLQALANAGVAVVLADHHVDEALRICSRACLFLGGDIALQASPGEFREHPLVRHRYLG